jgi:hypothetical protein
MRRFTRPAATTLLVVGLLGTTLGITATGASATVRHSSQDTYCKAVLKLGDDVQQPDPNATEIPVGTAADLEKAFKTVAKAAPSKAIKKQDLTIAAYYGKVADGTSVADISAKEAEAYGKAYAKFGLYVATKCVASSIPDVTLPGGGKVEIPGT